MTKTYTLTILSLGINENIEVEGYPADQPFQVDIQTLRAAAAIQRALTRNGHPEAWANLTGEEKNTLISQVAAKISELGL